MSSHYEFTGFGGQPPVRIVPGMTCEYAGSLETASLDISIRPGPVVTLSGEIDIHSGRQLRDHLLHTVRRHGARLALDLTGVTFIDCAGISVLLATRRRAKLEGGSLRVIGASPHVRRVLALTGLQHVLMPTALADAAASSDSVGWPIGLEDHRLCQLHTRGGADCLYVLRPPI